MRPGNHEEEKLVHKNPDKPRSRSSEMKFLSSLWKFGNSAPSAPVAAGSAVSSEYAKWTKEQLIQRVEELESKLEKPEEVTEGQPQKKRRKVSEKKAQKPFDFSKHNTRFIALKFAYLGWNYNGLAIQNHVTPQPTVEGTLLEAMMRCKLVPSMETEEYNFSRCGRTDKGVSAMNQVVSLRVRSNLTAEEQLDPANDSKEICYVNILNQILPEDIRVSAVCLRPPPKFDARFSCKSRHYKYMFHKKGLDVEKMQEAAAKYEGEHDFRNFCKLDGSKQITNFKRTILSSKILKINEDFYCFDLVGSAFLWHQVRCMVANLFLVGQGLEEPSLIDTMMDIEKTPQKPIYNMASDIPLILYDCTFEDIEWTLPDNEHTKTYKGGSIVYSMWLRSQLQALVTNTLLETYPPFKEQEDRICVNVGDGKGKVTMNYVPLAKRKVLEPVDVVNARYKKKQDIKNPAKFAKKAAKKAQKEKAKHAESTQE